MTGASVHGAHVVENERARAREVRCSILTLGRNNFLTRQVM
ncbi:unnamed protein product [Mycena citricolor]|uniref:Uncharacterized protein n=1 Tax=Mycena citricolor TaxID=2018698 RepID=A0AAD2JZA3_9AGAR|nr:unnamed protein product [Mycena citricolor]